MKFEIEQDKAGRWRWALVANNNRIMADSGEGYNTEGNARRAIKSLRRQIGGANIVVKEPE